MTDRRTSREIIWKHAFDYRWRRWQDINGNPGVDAFHRQTDSTVPYPNAPELIVWYSRDGRRITDASLNGFTLGRYRRDDVMDIIEGHHS